MEEIVESIFKGLGRAISYIVVQIIFEFLFYYIGWPFMKIITLGKYPKGKKSYGWHIESREGVLTSLLGLIVVVGVTIFVVTTYNAT